MAKSVKVPAKPPANGLKRLEERLKQLPQTFPTYVRANFDRLSQIVQSAGRNPEKWQIIADWAVEEDHTGGKPLTAAAAQRAYEREAKRRKGEAQKTAAKPPKAQPAVIPPPVRIEEKPAPVQTAPAGTASSRDAAMARMRAQFKPITIPKRQEKT